MNLSENFSLSELIYSDMALRKSLENTPNVEQMENLKLVCQNIL